MFIFEIFGDPVPQKQTKFRVCGKFAQAYDPSSQEKGYIQWQIRPDSPKEPLTCPVEVHMTFYMPIPKSTSKVRAKQMLNGVILHTKRPDIDNLAYLVTNAMKEIVYADDSQITDLILRKRYGDSPRTVIKVIPLEELQQIGATRCD